MLYSELIWKKSSLLARFSHNSRLKLICKLIAGDARGENISVLDVGAGDGHILSYINRIVKYYHAYEPFDDIRAELIDTIKNNTGCVAYAYSSIGQIKLIRPDYILCLEVLEHLNSSARKNLYTLFKDLCLDTTTIFVSVPIEIGPPALVKGVNRMLKRDLKFNTLNISNILRGFIGYDIDRGNESYIHEHTGFNYKNLEKELRANFIVTEKIYSPFPFLGPKFNSQVFYRMRLC